MAVFYICAVPYEYMWQSRTWNVANATEKLDFQFYLVLINIHFEKQHVASSYHIGKCTPEKI